MFMNLWFIYHVFHCFVWFSLLNHTIVFCALNRIFYKLLNNLYTKLSIQFYCCLNQDYICVNNIIKFWLFLSGNVMTLMVLYFVLCEYNLQVSCIDNTVYRCIQRFSHIYIVWDLQLHQLWMFNHINIIRQECYSTGLPLCWGHFF